MDSSDYVIYVDESGDHNLQKFDKDYPVFVLSFCMVQKTAYSREIVPALQEFKFRWWGHDMAILHESEIRSRSGWFKFLGDPVAREEFRAGLMSVLAAAPWTIVAAVIDKPRLLDKYVRPFNPYDLALAFCMERAYFFLREHRQVSAPTYIVAEGRGKTEDYQLKSAFHRIRDGENQFRAALPFKLVVARKGVNSSGLQVADLVGRPIGLRHLRPDQPNRTWDVIEPKLRRSSAKTVEGYGLKRFP